MVSEPFDLADVTARLVGERGDCQLVSLTREELYAVGDDPVLGHAADVVWWDGLTEREQALVVETAQRGLVARNLLVPDGAGEMVSTEDVRVVLAVRRAPCEIVVLTDPSVHTSDGSGAQLALLGLPTATGEPYAYLASMRIEGVYLHRLVVADLTPDVAVEWLLRAADDESGDDAVQVGRTVELLRAGDGQAEVERRRAVLVGSHGSWALSEIRAGVPGEATPVDAEVLRSWLVRLLGRAT